MSNRLEKALAAARFSLEVEGFLVKEEHTNLVKKVLEGKITENEFRELALKRALEKE